MIALLQASSRERQPADPQRGSRTDPARLRRQAVMRRRNNLIGCGGYALSSFALTLYSLGGHLPMTLVVSYLFTGIGAILVLMCLSEIAAGKVTDHYLTLPHVIVHTTIKIFYASVAPQVGVALLIEIFVVVGFISLQMPALHIFVAWVFMALGFGGLFLGSNVPVELPDDTLLDRIAAFLAFVLPIGACSAVGFYASSLRKSLYKRTQELRRANARIEELASRDELTGALNRRNIMQAFADEVARCRDGAACSSIALIDIDWFKRINDIHGHPAGDAVLRKFAATVQSRIAASDLFGRYGGEEFLLIMPNRDFDAGFDLVESLRQEVDALDWSTATSPLEVTFSGGVAPIARGLTLEGILSRADAALYMAKRDGRNQVHMDLKRLECA